MKRMVMVVVVSVLAARDGAADELPAPAAEPQLSCRAGKKVIAPGKKQQLDSHIVCTVALAEPTRARLSAWIVQDRGDEPGGGPEPRRLETDRAVSDDAGGRFVYKLDPFVRTQDFLPCRDFTIQVELVGDGRTLWEGALTVATSCKKPKKLKAKLSCEHYTNDGAGPFSYPGNGAKVKPRLEGSLTCWIRAGKGKGVQGSLATITGIGDGQVEEVYVDDDDKQWTSGAVLEPDGDFVTCEPFAVKGALRNAVGQIVWTGKVQIAQRCPD